ncbi:MAG: hypothetical protein BMS9Abin06_0315 [Gammaproteobacteria bacterium]|nr:MAG: hypothetical protein BMS9Abin06_0315 [Gammaproteobacteria bacterium]
MATDHFDAENPEEPLINSPYRRRPVSKALKPLDSGIRQNDGKRINQSFLNFELPRRKDRQE